MGMFSLADFLHEMQVLFSLKNQNVACCNCDEHLTLHLLNTTCPVLANSLDPDQMASEEAN